MNTLLYRRVPGELVDDIEDEIIALRTRLMNNDVALMVLVEQARRANRSRGNDGLRAHALQHITTAACVQPAMPAVSHQDQ